LRRIADPRKEITMNTASGKTKVKLAAAVSLALITGAAAGQEITGYGEAITTALATNPAVTTAYYEFEATRESEAVARGELLPSVDLAGDYSWQDRQTPIVDFGDYEADSLRFSITQLLFDGFQARDQMRARRYEKLARYYDFYTASQQTALAATEAYLDTLLFQELVRYAEDNYVTHRQVYNKIAERAAGGVSQRVDLEQATARLALAESNLLTEVTNLHDTRVEFQRIVGLLPGEDLPLPQMPEQAIPATREDALRVAYQNSPDVNRAIEEMRAAREEHNATRGPMLPRFDLRYRNEQESNTDGILGDYDLEAVEVVMSYNLYRGGADAARRREFSNRYYAAIESRKDVCLSVRRETMIAYNDIDVLRRQVAYLEQQLEAQDRTRRAYNDQFDIGQRSLLDLLDSQNEYFDTQRALISARTQLLGAQARTLAQVGALIQALDVDGFNADKIAALELALERREREEIPACPEGTPMAINIDQEAIFERLNRSADNADDVFSQAEQKTPADHGIAADWLQNVKRAAPLENSGDS
jgi:adhesin transport system outer membrane protein